MINGPLNKVVGFFKRNRLLAISFFIFLLLVPLTEIPIYCYPDFVDWDTIITLTGLLLLTAGIKKSGMFSFIAYRISKDIHNERYLAVFLVFTAAILSMFLTNDIALFIIVPLTVSLRKISNTDYIKIIIFEAIGVNVGSSLTPIGNPQNIFLWHQWDISFFKFLMEMAFPVSLMSILLFAFLLVFFRSRQINHVKNRCPDVKKHLFCISTAFLIIFIISIELDHEIYFLPFIFITYLIKNRKVLFSADWGLILLFIIIFIDLHLFSELGPVQQLFNQLHLENPKNLFISGAFLSQMISNVPAAILLTKYSDNFQIIAHAVDIGGNGLMLASFANLIALRFIEDRSKYWQFHKYSLAYFLTSSFCYYCLM